jgi:S1-C subfamily serine protease
MTVSEPRNPNTRKLVPVVLAAALLGGGVGAGAVALIDDSGGGGTTTTVVQQAPLAQARGSDKSGDLTAAQIYERYAPAVVHVTAELQTRVQSPFDFFDRAERSEATGSGFLIDKDGHILTNNHVIEGASKVSVRFGDNKDHDARIIGRDPSTDLALLKVDPGDVKDIEPLPLGSSKDVRVGDPTVAIGNPFGLDRTLTTGVVSALQRKITAPDGTQITNVIQTDAAINPGNSGGPLIDATGRVIGINSQIQTGGTGAGNIGIGFAVPIDTAKALLPSLKKGRVERAYIGVETISVDESLEALDLPVDHGALVQRVAADSPAEKAGIEGGDLVASLRGRPITIGGDIIVKFDGKRVNSADHLTQLVTEKKPGDRVEIEVVRGRERKKLTVRLGTRPSNFSRTSVVPGGTP